ncbi:MAG: hypothetical protein CO114_01055 [Euryarchaeota archaeon CG_4_9_14_3_um_filter_38_12]|nr:MAG: hypothetical protein CO114_01055 [Euryarchaeota archaeon CG_4_9_14_3_um_filter_38_12]
MAKDLTEKHFAWPIEAEERTDGSRCTHVLFLYCTLIAYKVATYFYIMENTYNPINPYSKIDNRRT